MSKLRRSIEFDPVPSRGADRVVLSMVIFGALALIALVFAGLGGQDVKPAADSLVTVQQPTGWDRLQRAIGLAEPLPEPRGDTPGRRLGEGLVLSSRKFDGDVVGYMVGADSDSAMLDLARIRAGDVIMTLDGRPLDSARIEQLGDELSLLDAVDVNFFRDGVARKRVVNLRPKG